MGLSAGIFMASYCLISGQCTDSPFWTAACVPSFSQVVRAATANTIATIAVSTMTRVDRFMGASVLLRRADDLIRNFQSQPYLGPEPYPSPPLVSTKCRAVFVASCAKSVVRKSSIDGANGIRFRLSSLAYGAGVSLRLVRGASLL